MFGLGPMELMIVGVIAVLLFGKRLPEVAKSMGKSFTEFKKGMRGIEDEIHSSSYSAPSSSTYSNKYAVADEREEATAPKFEPPVAEPQTVDSAASSQA
jgi:sec-independent protein translocase protein TatA